MAHWTTQQQLLPYRRQQPHSTAAAAEALGFKETQPCSALSTSCAYGCCCISREPMPSRAVDMLWRCALPDA